MKILLTGANGMLGQDLALRLEKENYEVIRSDIDNLNITDMGQVEIFIDRENPDFIIHCAAYTNVEKAESEPELAFKINSLGTENLAKKASEKDIPILYISTDYVFDGTKNTPYLPNDEVNPLSVYGASKRKGEEAVLENCKKYYIARTSWLYGHKGKNFVETMLSLASKMPELKVVDDQIGCPTSVKALCDMIVKILKNNMEYGIYHTCGGGFTTWFGFAKEIFRLTNTDIKLTPCSSEEFKTVAKRPAYSIMDNAGLSFDWKISLKEYINERNV